MAYVLPRMLIIVVAWGVTCGLIKNLAPEANPMVFALAGLSWICGGIAYMAYQRKLRRDIAELERTRRYSINRSVG